MSRPVLIPERLRARRKELGLTIEQLAIKAKLANVTLSNYELGKVNPTSYNLNKLACTLGTDVRHLTEQHCETPHP